MGIRTQRYQCSPALVRSWARATRDNNPLHLDAGFAAGTRFGVPIVHGHLLAALVLNAVQATLGSGLTHGGAVSVRFRAPVPVGSTLTVTVADDGDAPPSARALVDDRDVLQIEITQAAP